MLSMVPSKPPTTRSGPPPMPARPGAAHNIAVTMHALRLRLLCDYLGDLFRSAHSPYTESRKFGRPGGGLPSPKRPDSSGRFLFALLQNPCPASLPPPATSDRTRHLSIQCYDSDRLAPRVQVVAVYEFRRNHGNHCNPGGD